MSTQNRTNDPRWLNKSWLNKALERMREFAYAQPAPKAPMLRPRVGVALGGGFARAIAHLGVLRVLEQEHIPIDYLAGTSAGALLAISYAAGHSFEDIAAQASLMRFKDFGRWQFSWLGLASNHRLEKYLSKRLGVTTFEELRIPLAIAATDLATGEPVYFSRGPLGIAIRASCAYPGMFCPVESEGRMLVDGFLAAPVPVDAVRAMGADVVIAVHLEGATERRPSSVVEVIGLSFNVLQRHADPEWRRTADVVIEPIVKDFLWDDFCRAPELISAGEVAARIALPELRAALALRPRKETSTKSA